MASIISAGTTSGTALNMTADTSGQLQFATGASATTAVTIDTSQNLQFNSGYGSVATAYGCRAWAQFTGGGSSTLTASGNVASVTFVATGQYTVTLTNAMPDQNGAIMITTGPNTSNNTASNIANWTSTSSINIRHFENNASANVSTLYIAIFR